MVANFVKLAEILGVNERYVWLLILALIWSLVWKAIALWKSARKNHLIWFILILVINSVGILEILYIFLFSKLNLKEKPKTRKKKKNRR